MSPNSQSKHTTKHARPAQRQTAWRGSIAATKFSMHECMKQTSWAYATMGWEHFPRPVTRHSHRRFGRQVLGASETCTICTRAICAAAVIGCRLLLWALTLPWELVAHDPGRRARHSRHAGLTLVGISFALMAILVLAIVTLATP
jgi:hypothetical protein